MNNKIIRNPFEAVNANYLTNAEIERFWTPPEVLFNEEACGANITGSLPVVFQGGRGSGKTMLMKYLSFDIKLKLHQNSVADLLHSNDSLGIYLRFSGTTLKALSGSKLKEDEWISIFSHYYEIVIGKQILCIIKEIIRSDGSIDTKNEINLCSAIITLIYGNSYRLNAPLNIENIIGCLNDLQYSVDTFLNNQIIDESVKFEHTILLRAGILSYGLYTIAVKYINALTDKRLIYLIDEYENFLEYQQCVINTLVKHCPAGITFRLGMRPYGFKTRETLNHSEFLKERDDFRLLNLESVLFSNNDKYKDFLFNICAKRLGQDARFANEGMQDIKIFLGDLLPEKEADIYMTNGAEKKLEDEFNKVISSLAIDDATIMELRTFILSHNVIISKIIILLLRKNNKKDIVSLMREYSEKGNKSQFHKNILDKNKEALLFILANDLKKKKYYAGFNTYVTLSSGIVRSFLQLCYEAFSIASFYEEKFTEGQAITWLNQTRAAEKAADFFYKEIESIPQYGLKIKAFMDELGVIFRTLNDIKNRLLIEPEPSYFTTVKSNLSEQTKEVLNEAVKWSILQEKPAMKPKSKSSIFEEVYLYNRIFAPKYTLAFRTRWPVRFEPKEVEILIHGNDSEKSKIRNTIIRRQQKKIEEPKDKQHELWG
jgi:hypothetical protein